MTSHDLCTCQYMNLYNSIYNRCNRYTQWLHISHITFVHIAWCILFANINLNLRSVCSVRVLHLVAGWLKWLNSNIFFISKWLACESAYISDCLHFITEKWHLTEKHDYALTDYKSVEWNFGCSRRMEIFFWILMIWSIFIFTFYRILISQKHITNSYFVMVKL